MYIVSMYMVSTYIYALYNAYTAFSTCKRGSSLTFEKASFTWSKLTPHQSHETESKVNVGLGALKQWKHILLMID